MPIIDGEYYTDDEYREATASTQARPPLEDEHGNPIDPPDTEGGPSPPSGSSRADYERAAREFLENTSRKYGAPVEPSDLTRMMEYYDSAMRGNTTQAQISQFNNALDAQYKRRGSNTPGRTTSGGGGGGNAFWDPPSLSGYGAPPDPYGETYTTLARPAWLQGEYIPPSWTEQFVAPTAASLDTDPGYQARLAASQRGFERSAASRGSVLSGGFVGRTLPRAQQELASQEYGNVFKRAYDTYQQRYGEFADTAARGFGARQLNEATYQGDVGAHLNQFQTRYRGYQDMVENRRRAEEDRWKREYDLARLGLDATTAGGGG